MARKLRRVKGKKWIAGVCAGVGYRIGKPVWMVRLLWTCMVIFWGFGILLYVLMWILMPVWEETPTDYNEVTGD